MMLFPVNPSETLPDLQHHEGETGRSCRRWFCPGQLLLQDSDKQPPGENNGYEGGNAWLVLTGWFLQSGKTGPIYVNNTALKYTPKE